METVAQFIEQVGRARFVAFTGYSQQLVTRAIADNLMPSGWYPSVRDLCVADAHTVPESLFRWSDKRKVPANGEVAQ